MSFIVFHSNKLMGESMKTLIYASESSAQGIDFESFLLKIYLSNIEHDVTTSKISFLSLLP